ncbi:MAG TPA: amino acid adenylation domain-containing protein [Actinophytocola sp.]|jgi:amino acid adenylation domain-containing protein|nr:amino acid adenylation domain-containing protein [Actinophytocola sp.]
MWTDGDGPGSVVERFEDRARHMPDAVALVDTDGTTVSYAELNRRANRLARLLAGRGVGPETPVALLLDRSSAQVLAILAVLKAGGGYVPVDPGYPAKRIEFVLADSRAALLITAGPAPFDIPAVVLDEVDTTDQDDSDLGHRPGPEQMAYVIYTSGSTGTPKGVVVSHRNVARLFTATASTFHFGPEDVWTLFHSYSFDFSVWELWGALLHGGRVVLVSREVGRSPEDFLDLLVRERVTVLNQTPSAFFRLAATAGEYAAGELALRLVILGGESVVPARLAAWYDRHPDDRPVVVNGYGVTETTVFTTFRMLDARLAVPGTGSLIGAPMADLAVRILDEDLRPMPRGEVGELHIGGPGVARGYLNRPSLTAERFVPDPDGEPGERMYRSGDLARVSGDGELEFHGRADGQVKLRGFRIELGEIEVVVSACPRVRQAAVLVREDRPGEAKLTAYVVPGLDADELADEFAGELADEVRAWAGARLPGYMVPAVVVPVVALPLTVNGKLDRAALPAPRTVTAAAATTDTARTVAAIWAEMLDRHQIGAGDDFLELGGHSLVAVRIAARIRADLGTEVAVRDLYDHPKLADFASRVDVLRASAPAGPPPIRRIARERRPVATVEAPE